jgi:hypothetical protein
VVPVAGGQPGRHSVPRGQQVTVPLDSRPGVVPAGQPQMPFTESTHAMPDLQQVGPHGVVPAAQQQLVDGL